MKVLREVELHPPIVDFLRSLGYEVRSEVKDCDVVGLRPDGSGSEEIVVVELKRGLTIDLLIQGVKRQRNAELVYLAIPRPERFWFTRKWRDILHLLRRLELGLVLVNPMASAGQHVEVVLDPLPLDRARSQAQHASKRTGLLKEFKARSADLNIGGSTGVPLMTGYRERALAIAIQLESTGPLSPARLRSDAKDSKTALILRDNHYGWFERVERGIYDLSESGRMAAITFTAEHPEIAARYQGEPLPLPDGLSSPNSNPIPTPAKPHQKSKGPRTKAAQSLSTPAQ